MSGRSQPLSAASSRLPTSARDYRVDFWRGVALVMIFINHVPGQPYEYFTSRNFGFSDAAELFVFLAGFASAYAYARLFFAGSRLVACLKAWRRAGVLYLVHIALTMGAVALFSWATLVTGQGELMRRLALTLFIEQPLETTIGFATLGHQLGYVNILPMYMAMLVMLPVHLVLAAIDRRLMLAVAVLAWILVDVLSLNLPNYPMPGGWFFNPLAWQVIFAAGLFCGLNRQATGAAVPYRPWLFALALAYLIAAFVTVKFQAWGSWQILDLPRFVDGFDKTFVSAPRLLHVLALAYVFANVAPTSPFANFSKGNPFVMMGRHSLPIFAVGTMLSLAAQAYKFDHDIGFLADSLVIGGGLVALFALARFLDWWRSAAQTPAISRDPIATAAKGGIATPSGDAITIRKT